MNDPRNTIEIDGTIFEKTGDGFHYAWIGTTALTVGWDFYSGEGEFGMLVQADDMMRRVELPGYLDKFSTFDDAARAAIRLARADAAVHA